MTINKKIKAKYTTDFGIRIYAPKPSKNYWRISYVDQEGKLRDTTATSEKTALDKATEIVIETFEKITKDNILINHYL